jgi:hypothetical protein
MEITKIELNQLNEHLLHVKAALMTTHSSIMRGHHNLAALDLQKTYDFLNKYKRVAMDIEVKYRKNENFIIKDFGDLPY